MANPKLAVFKKFAKNIRNINRGLAFFAQNLENESVIIKSPIGRIGDLKK